MQTAPLTPATALTAWQFAPAVTAAVAVAVAAYLYGAWRVSHRRPRGRWSAWRTAAFVAGLLVVVVALESSVGRYDDVLFSAHMVQHLLLIMVAPPLLVAGRPLTLLLHATRNPVHRTVKRWLRSRPVSVLTSMPVVLLLYAVVVVTTHLTPLMNVVLQNSAAHDAEHVLYLVTGYLYFLPVVGSEPLPSRPSLAQRFVLVLATMPADTFVGIALMTVSHELFPAYLHDGRTWGPSPLADLHLGGQIMWIGSDVLMAVIALALAFRFTRDPRRAGDVGIAVDGPRATALRRRMLAAGVADAALLSGRTIDSGADERMASYNAYLAALHEEDA